MLTWHYLDQATYDAGAGSRAADGLYFISDTKKIYKGDNDFTESVRLHENGTDPSPAAMGVLYVNKATLEGRIWTGSAWQTVVQPVQATLSATDTAKPVSGKAVADYVKTQADALSGDISGLTERVGDLEADMATKAAQADLTALSGVVDTKAAQADLTALSGEVDTLEGEVAKKAAQADLTATNEKVAANEGAIGALQTALGETNEKVAANETAIGTKAAQADLEAAVADIEALEKTVADNAVSANVVKDVAYSATTQKFTVTKADDSTKELDLSALAADLVYDKTSGELKVVNAAGVELGTGINLDLERFVSEASYDHDAGEITLKFNDNTDPLVIDIGDLVDTYTAENSTTIAMTVTGNAFKAEAIVAATAGNMLQATDSGLYVAATDISGKMDKDTDAVEGNLAKFDANGNAVDAGLTAGGATMGSSATTLASEAGVAAAIAAAVQAAVNDITNSLATKMDKVATGHDNEIIVADANGNAKLSGFSAGTATLGNGEKVLASEAAVAAAVQAAKTEITQNITNNNNEVTNQITEINEAIEALEGDVATKAAQADLTALSGVVDTKAAQSDLTALSGTVETLSGVVDTKAAQSDLNATNQKVSTLEANMATKAAQADLEALQGVVNGKVDATKITQTVSQNRADYVTSEAAVLAAMQWKTTI